MPEDIFRNFGKLGGNPGWNGGGADKRGSQLGEGDILGTAGRLAPVETAIGPVVAHVDIGLKGRRTCDWTGYSNLISRLGFVDNTFGVGVRGSHRGRLPGVSRLPVGVSMADDPAHPLVGYSFEIPFSVRLRHLGTDGQSSPFAYLCEQ